MGTNAPNAILAINSLDRFTGKLPGGQTNQALGNALQAQYDNKGQPCNDFTIFSSGALIYGYMTKLIVSEIQIQYNVPTVLFGRNDTFWIIQASGGPSITYAEITIPYGYYTPEELAAVLEALILASDFQLIAPEFTVTYNATKNIFVFSSNNGIQFYFPSLAEIKTVTANPNYSNADFQNNLKCYRMLGMTVLNSNENTEGGFANVVQISTAVPNLLYTPYIDITSQVLTKYQNIKDTDTSASKLNSIIARIFLTGFGTSQILPNNAIGSAPFTVVQDLNNPKVIRWNRDEAIYNIDFQLRDQYGDLIWIDNSAQYSYATEFQMTLLCIEGERYE